MTKMMGNEVCTCPDFNICHSKIYKVENLVQLNILYTDMHKYPIINEEIKLDFFLE